MNDLTPQALQVLAVHHGAATGRMLQLAGISANKRRRLLADGLLESDFEGVYRLAGRPATLEARCAELCLAYPKGFVTGRSGGRLTGLRRMGRGDDIDLSVRHGANIGPIPGVHLRQTTRIEPYHVQRRADGIAIASPPRLAFDLAADLTEIDHASVVEQLLAEGRCTLATLGRIGKDLVHPRRPGSMLFLATMSKRLSGGASESHPELELGRLLRDRGVPVMTQYRMVLPSGRDVRFDLAVPEVKWAIEIDVWFDHFTIHGAGRDRQRDRECHSLGWQIDRVTALDLADPQALADELAALFHARLRAAG